MIIKKSFYFIRHGETAWNAERKLQGQTDIPLNEAGMQQAASLQALVSKLSVDKIFHSPLKRAAQTAEIACIGLTCPKIAVDELKECYYGSLEGKPSTGRSSERIKQKDYDGESYESYSARIIKGVNYVLSQEGNPLIVGHGGNFDMLTCIMNIPYVNIKNCTLLLFIAPTDAKPQWTIAEITD
ncbi:hypothetical protein A3F66_04350 [candidate division TM6 bacterium RIFCSPHIGHO2_12_FULL_32_22]|nr:MAG: hypothetical protein A3F66_04350 [candidate division TM6 bacterium RIFCSPHIGHO2_12_FULL_32_22]